jgi:phage/plasmid-like protein (TIGR03299 family)
VFIIIVMAHNLTQNEDGSVEFFSAVTRGWHNLGQLSERKLTSAEAIELAGLNWEVEQVPALHQTPSGDLLEIPDNFVVRRTDNHRPLSIMSSKYQVIQNRETFDFADDIIGGGQAVWDTAGSLAGGKVVFMQVELEGSLFVKNNPDDKTLKRILFVNSHDGSKALTGMVTPIRVVCQNTLGQALKNNTNQFKIYHRKNFQSKKEEAQKILGLANAYFDDLQFVMNQLASEEVAKTYVEGFVSTLIPNTKEDIATRTENRRNEIVNLYSNGRGNNGRTKWDLYNAVTEYVDHHSTGRLTGTRLYQSEAGANVEQEQRFQRAILGSGALLKQKAMDLLLN